MRSGEQFYIVGKGRTGSAEFPADNQNWAIRIREQEGWVVSAFFLQRHSRKMRRKAIPNWHRWTSIGIE